MSEKPIAPPKRCNAVRDNALGVARCVKRMGHTGSHAFSRFPLIGPNSAT